MFKVIKDLWTYHQYRKYTKLVDAHDYNMRMKNLYERRIRNWVRQANGLNFSDEEMEIDIIG